MTAVGSRTPAIIGFLIAGAALLLISFLANQDGTAGDVALPALHILQPSTSDTVVNPLELRFVTPAALSLTAQGWTVNGVHLHLLVDGDELMPAAADITATDSAYIWRLPVLAPGAHRLYLTWAGRHHGNLAGPADTVTFIIRP